MLTSRPSTLVPFTASFAISSRNTEKSLFFIQRAANFFWQATSTETLDGSFGLWVANAGGPIPGRCESFMTAL
jgi:hypothetical protein